MNSSLYLLSRGFGSPENKVQLLYGACSLGELEVVTELVELHKVVGKFNFPFFEKPGFTYVCALPRIAMHLIIARARAV